MERTTHGSFSVVFQAESAAKMLAIWLPRFDPAHEDHRYWPWERSKLRIYRLDIPAVHAFAKPRPWAWALCYDIALTDVWEPHIQGATDDAVDVTKEMLDTLEKSV